MKLLGSVLARLKQVARHKPLFGSINGRNDIFRLLKLKHFTDKEISDSFERLKSSPSETTVRAVDAKRHFLDEINKEDGSLVSRALVTLPPDIDNSVSSLMSSPAGNEDGAESGITLAEYKDRILFLSDSIDPKIWPIAASFFLMGTSLGVVVPCMPLLVGELGITPSQFGFVISSFAMAKLVSNIPATHYVDIIGRKPLMVAGLGMCAVGLSGLGMSLYPGFGFPAIIACRVISGIGVSAFVSGSFMYLIDISTSRNRARTNAPAQAGFNGGLAIGPALGGVLIEYAGISYAYFIVGGLFAGLAILNQVIIKDSFVVPSKGRGPSDSNLSEKHPMADSFSVAYYRWKALFTSISEIRNILVLSTSYWFTLSAAQFTLLPLLMMSPSLHLSVSEIASCFGMMSITSFLLSQPLAGLTDRYDKVYVSCGGCLLLATSCLTMPLASSFEHLMISLLPLAIGSTIINTAPPSHVANISPDRDRSQALSLLRTVGDIGFLSGATAAGVVAAILSVESAMAINGGILIASALTVSRRHYLSEKNLRATGTVEKEKKQL